MKQVILVRKDLKMPKGKTSTMVAHASVESALKSDKDLVKKWYKQGMKKIILKVNSKKELLKYKNQADKLKITNTLITDAAKTFFKKPTTTCLAIGPDKEEKIDKITKNLKLLE